MALLQTSLVLRALQVQWVVDLLKAVVPPLDKFLLRLSRGWINTAMQSVALVETTGAKSGLKREIATLCLVDGSDILLVASNWGQDKHPAWLLNIRAHPSPHVTFRGYKGSVRARELNGEERAAAWSKLIVFNPQYAHYQSQTQRLLPVLRLERSKN